MRVVSFGFQAWDRRGFACYRGARIEVFEARISEARYGGGPDAWRTECQE